MNAARRNAGSKDDRSIGIKPGEVTSDQPWHDLPGEEILERLETSAAAGLDPQAVRRRQEEFGPNRLTPRQGIGPLRRFLLQFHQPLVYILLGSAAITAALNEWLDAAVIFGVVLVNAFIGYLQEARAVEAIASLARIMTTSAQVLRGGEQRQIDAAELVPGDIVLLRSGDKVPADLRLLATRELQIDESALTGESVAVSKDPSSLPRDTLLADRTNMAYSSTLVTYGVATGVVVATGDRSEIGRISELIAGAEELATPLTRKIARFSSLLLYVILALAAVTFAVGVLRGEAWLDMFMAVVALAVGAIPEGLPAAVTITLAIGVGKMARRNAIIRKLPAVETLGSTTVICSDKTGTLTQNQMTVQKIVAGGELYTLSGSGYVPEGDFSCAGGAIDPGTRPALRECLAAGALCNDAQLLQDDSGWRVEGDPTEGALLVAARKGGLLSATLATQLPRLDAIPFESAYQYMATRHRQDAGTVIYLKGAVEALLPRCATALSGSGVPSPCPVAEILAQAEELARQGLRVLAFARREEAEGSAELRHDQIDGGLTFLGLQGMIDPPRPEAVAAVKVCQEAGIRVKMITGDHSVTAAAIARQIGLAGEADANGDMLALNGRELAQLSDAELVTAVKRISVFARVAPEQKLRLVEALQTQGEVVAMTGDGVNDAPALRQADIGVAMGVTGTEVAKEAADMLLTDDNFSTIEAAVEEGRGVYDNLVKFITWTLPTNLGEGLVILAAVFAGVELPITPLQILWINMTTAVLLGLMLAFEPKEPGLMQRPPLPHGTPLLTRELTGRIVLVGLLLLTASFGLFEWQLQQGESLAAARTCATNVFVFGELFYLFNCRSLGHSVMRIGCFSNRWLLGGVGLMIVLQLCFTYLPAMQRAFGTAALEARAWGAILVASLVVYLVIEGEKALRRRKTAAKRHRSDHPKQGAQP